MKRLSVTTALCTLLAGAAFAEGPTPIPMDPEPLPPAPTVMNWGGFYAGGTLAYGGGDMSYRNPDFDWTIDDDVGFGAFAGYNWQRGNLVFGGEVAVLKYNGVPAGFPAESFGAIVDLKARLGFAAGQALIYGFAGYSISSYDIPVAGNWDLDGMNYGLGVDFAVRDQLFVGVEYIMRNLDADETSTPGQTQANDLDMLQLRVGWKF